IVNSPPFFLKMWDERQVDDDMTRGSASGKQNTLLFHLSISFPIYNHTYKFIPTFIIYYFGEVVIIKYRPYVLSRPLCWAMERFLLNMERNNALIERVATCMERFI